ncbi:MAG: AsnC family transcriptional regulator [Armatimonadota bacterium]
MDEIDRQLLNIAQSDFPIAPRPYKLLGEQVGITEQEALERVRKLVQSGIIRRIGPSFDSKKLGYVSTLVAARVPRDRLEDVAVIVGSFGEVTHNYERDHDYNLWFTIICDSKERLREILDEIRRKTGEAEMYSLPAERTFKIKAEFEL